MSDMLTDEERANVTDAGAHVIAWAMRERGMTEREAYRWISGGPRCTFPGSPMMRNGRYL